MKNKEEIPRLFDSSKLHYLFGIVVKKSNNLKRNISYFRTDDGIVICINIFNEGEKPCLCVAVIKEIENLKLEETYYLYLDGSCQSHISARVMSVFGRGLHCLQKIEEHRPEEVLNLSGYDNNWFHKKLHILASWLADEKTVRFDPYHPDRILGEDEESESDLLIAANLEIVKKFQKKLSQIELTPGIHQIKID
jgi:hypothetical protein